MNELRRIFAWLSSTLNDAALAIAWSGEWLRRPHKAQFVEQADGSFVLLGATGNSGPGGGTLLRVADGKLVGPMPAKTRSSLAGSQIAIELQASRFVFRPLELPRRASEFLEGIVRAQIDRLTPWTAAEAVFGWSDSPPSAGERIEITVAATARDAIVPILKAFAEFGADSIALATVAEAPGAPTPIRILAQQAGGGLHTRRIKQTLVAILLIACLTLGAAIAAAVIVGARLDAEALDLTHRIADRRIALLNSRGSAADEALAGLEARKRSTPASVIVIEALSQTLPDNTFLTELHIERGRLQIAGLTRDAPALIRLIEQSQHFSRATFFAPTTKSPTENGERFHIEAQIEPVFPTPP
ncbi:PilN domain-containing protein [Methylocapsa sp. S129]|uniref:PilN domain-containing protein n=1 Tax=Methylocapsa sp. S129 TaxID=1641869 RepID=UPI00131CAB0A|nr:PilN domain-containing protein [Methylocapsa sp. S129]